MGSKTLVIFRINARDMDNLQETEEQLREVKSGELKDIKRVPIGFGVEVIKAAFLIDEKSEGALEELTKEVQELDSVEDAEVEGMTLL
ncbi:MAG TPA: hypothetical protein VJK05_02890 [archaeon]|nr:hypothetical protein [archaeon]